MDDSFEEGADAVEEGHDGNGALDAEDVAHEVLGELAVEVAVEEVAGDGAGHHHVEEEHGEDQLQLVLEARAEHRLQAAEAQEAEVLHVALHQHLVQEAPEREHPQVLADGVVEQPVEQPVQQHEHQQAVWHVDHEVLHRVPQEPVVRPFHCRELLVRLRRVVLQPRHDALLDERQLLRINDF